MTVRVRLTLLYGLLFLVASAALLAISYELVSSRVPTTKFAQVSGNDIVLRANKLARDTQDVPDSDRAALAAVAAMPPDKALAVVKSGAAQLSPNTLNQLVASLPIDVRNGVLHQLLVQSLLALGLMAIASAGLGWFVAGRVLRPLTQITDTARRLSASNLDERIDLHGPDDELRRLANTFDAMLDRLAASFEGQRRFVANASHELRTPLTIMATELDVTLARPDATPAELRAMGATLRTAVDRSDRLITSLLALARVEEGLEVVRPADLAVIARETLERRNAELVAANLTSTSDLAAVIIDGDPGLLDRLADNLVENAIRHNVADGWVKVTTRKEDYDAILEVANGGLPIAPDAVEDLFAPFHRLDGRAGSQRSMGLGLAIVRAIARAHKGTALAAPLEGGGLSVAVRLPASSDSGPGHRG